MQRTSQHPDAPGKVVWRNSNHDRRECVWFGADPETVAKRFLEYADAGIETFILSGYPHLEEAYRVAELLFPLLPISKSDSTEASDGTGPRTADEVVGNEFRVVK